MSNRWVSCTTSCGIPSVGVAGPDGALKMRMKRWLLEVLGERNHILDVSIILLIVI